MVRFCDLESADCMRSLLLSLYAFHHKSGHFCVSRVLLDRQKKKRLLVVCRIWN